MPGCVARFLVTGHCGGCVWPATRWHGAGRGDAACDGWDGGDGDRWAPVPERLSPAGLVARFGNGPRAAGVMGTRRSSVSPWAWHGLTAAGGGFLPDRIVGEAMVLGSGVAPAPAGFVSVRTGRCRLLVGPEYEGDIMPARLGRGADAD